MHSFLNFFDPLISEWVLESKFYFICIVYMYTHTHTQVSVYILEQKELL